MESLGYLVPRLVIGLMIQILCSYSTLPLYAIVTQMGDSYKRAIFADHMQETLHGWVEGVRKRPRPGAGSSIFRTFRRESRKQSPSMLQADDNSCSSTRQLDVHGETVFSP